MYLHFSLSAGIGALELSGTVFLIAIAVLACLLGLEIAGTLILIRRMSRARREKEVKEQAQDLSQKHYCGAAVFMLSVVPKPTYLTLLILACLVAVAAIAFLTVLLVFRKKGYTFISSKDALSLAKAEREQKENQVTVEAPVIPADTEEQRQDAYTDADEPLSAFDEPLVIPEEDDPWTMPILEESLEEEAQPTEEEAVLEEEMLEETLAEEEIEGELLSQTQEEQPMSVAPAASSDQTFADGTQPYKIVEKIVTETQKEVVREVPAAAPEKSEAAEQLMEKLTDFLDYELQKRKEADLALTENAENQDAALEAFAQKDDFAEDAEEEDEDELDEAEDPSEEEEDDVDSEEPDSEDRFTGNERIIGFDENTGCYIVAHYRKSFEAKLIQARPHIKQYYSELKNALLSYKGTKSRISWTADSFHNGRSQIAKINVKTNILELYLALEPDSLEGSVYRGKNVGSKKKYTETPFLYKLRTPRKFKWAMELVQRTCEEHGLSPIDIEKVDYEQQYPFETTESLVERKLIKEYIREEKPATTFELAPDHVPAVPEEDESVIPANANFLWELDNDMLEQKEEEPAREIAQEEPVLQEEESEQSASEGPVEEVAAEPVQSAEPVSNVVKETVKITEVRYTERYYADAIPSYEQIITTEESILPADAVQASTVIEDAVETEDITEESSEITDVESEEDETAEELSWNDPLDEPIATDSEAVEETENTDEEAEGEFFFDDQPEEEVEEIYEEVYEEEPEEEAEEIYEEVYEEEPEEEVEEIYEEVYEEEPEEEVEEIYEEVYEEEPEEEVEEIYEEIYEEVYEEEPEEEVEEIYEEVYEEEPEEEVEEIYEEVYEEVYEEEEPEEEVVEIYEGDSEIVYEEVVYEDPAQRERASKAASSKDKVTMDPSIAVIDICAVAAYFNDGETVNLEALKARGLVVPTAKTLKIYSGGTLDKRLSVEAHHFSLEAIFAIGTAGGETSMLY